jgi:hypothetical protein
MENICSLVVVVVVKGGKGRIENIGSLVVVGQPGSVKVGFGTPGQSL